MDRTHPLTHKTERSASMSMVQQEAIRNTGIGREFYKHGPAAR